ncbi:hypothetical protein [Paenibacillus thermotolerans]|uniref:hypothetical protein n=1 Tax=Paenibacillus thermotolerans TaxID=3027807 RepID=UPI002367F22A|nr:MULTISPECIES: hypothetical protein [unclassified Paenibacillus]
MSAVSAGRDAVVSGSGVISGGQYDKVKISGSGKIQGTINAQQITISGSGSVNGDAYASEYSSSGSSSVKGGFFGRKFSSSGSASVKGEMQAEEVRTNGSFACEAKMRTNVLVSNGSLRCEGDVEAEELRVDGMVTIRGMLNTNSGDITARGSSYIREIGCERLTVRRDSISRLGGFRGILRFIARLFFGRDTIGYLRSETIEGTDLSLECTHASVVRGERVTIGTGCEIGLVEYSKELSVHPEAIVKDRRKM